MTTLLNDLIQSSAARTADALAIAWRGETLNYRDLAQSIFATAAQFLELGLGRRDRVAIYLDKRPETVQAIFGAATAGGVFVPINPLLKPEQVAYILRDCNVRILVTSADRFLLLSQVLAQCPDLRVVLTVKDSSQSTPEAPPRLTLYPWDTDGRRESPPAGRHPVIDADMAAILYTSGSTGQPKGVVLSHRNLIAGACSVAQYLENRADDRILAVLPFSFDYGLSQLTTAFLVGAQAVLIDYLLPRDVIRAVTKYRITGLAAVPPLWIQLAQLDWPAGIDDHLRYMTNSGGAMPATTLNALRQRLPKSRFFLMYGLTEAFRSTYLPPEEIDRRPGSMGKAIPNAEIQVVQEDGTSCVAGEPGELVHRGTLVSLGYWNDPARTSERFRPAPGQPAGLPMPEMAVWSGDTVRMDEDGYLYFVGRRDEMIKTSGYRVSPGEIEESLYASGLVSEAAAFGIPHPVLGQAIVLCVLPKGRLELELDTSSIMSYLKERLPAFMMPAHLDVRREPLPRNANGKIDRKQLSIAYQDFFNLEST